MRANYLALIVLGISPSLSAAITDLVASPDGKTVYFNGPNTPYVLTEPGRPVASSFLPHDVVGTLGANNFYAKKYCGSEGSTCFLAPDCIADFRIFDTTHPEQLILESDRRTSFVRLDPTGSYAWIEQTDPPDCLGLYPRTPSRNGFYTLDGATQLAARGSATLANHRIGRRAIAIGPRALTLADGRLNWLSRDTTTPVLTTASKISEAVTDTSGRTVVYAQAETGRLHWIESTPFNQSDTDLNITGFAPAVTGDGQTLVYLTAANHLAAYHRPTRSTRQLGSDTYTAFTVSDDAAFAGTADNRVLRFDLNTGTQTELASHLPEVTAVVAPPGFLYAACPYYCYGEPDVGQFTGRGMLLQIEGRNLDYSGWRLKLYINPTPVEPLSVTSSRLVFQIPSDNSASFIATADLSIPNGPGRYTFKLGVQSSALVCLSTTHQDYTPVTPQNPAHSGDTIHVFTTGLTPAEPVPDGQPNPTDHLVAITRPPILNANLIGWETLFSGLAPALIGVQQLDILVGEPAASSTAPLFTSGFNCSAPPVALEPYPSLSGASPAK